MTKLPEEIEKLRDELANNCKCPHPEAWGTFRDGFNAGYLEGTKREERLRVALREMQEHLCDGTGDTTCSQMWYQDCIDEALAETDNK